MGNIYKADFQVDNGTDYDKYNFSTTADQVSYTKNGKETNVQAELNALNTGIPALTFDNTWQICYKVTGWGLFVLIPLISTAQKLTVTKAEMFIRLSGTWESLTITRTRAFGPYHQIIFEDRNGLTDGIYLCRITGKLEK